MFKQNLRNQQPFNLLPKSPEPYQERRWQCSILHSGLTHNQHRVNTLSLYCEQRKLNQINYTCRKGWGAFRIDCPHTRTSVYKRNSCQSFCSCLTQTGLFWVGKVVPCRARKWQAIVKITLLRVIPTMTCWVEVVRWGLSLRIWWEEWRIWEHWFQVSLA